MTFPGLARLRAAVAALRGRVVIPPATPSRQITPAMPDVSAAMARVEEMRATMAANTKKLGEVAAILSNSHRKTG